MHWLSSHVCARNHARMLPPMTREFASDSDISSKLVWPVASACSRGFVHMWPPESVNSAQDLCFVVGHIVGPFLWIADPMTSIKEQNWQENDTTASTSDCRGCRH